MKQILMRGRVRSGRLSIADISKIPAELGVPTEANPGSSVVLTVHDSILTSDLDARLLLPI